MGGPLDHRVLYYSNEMRRLGLTYGNCDELKALTA